MYSLLKRLSAKRVAERACHILPGLPCALCVQLWRALLVVRAKDYSVNNTTQNTQLHASTLHSSPMSVVKDLHELYHKYGRDSAPPFFTHGT